MYTKISIPDVVRKSCLVQRFAGEEIYGHRMTIAEHHFEVVTYVIYILDALNAKEETSVSDATFNSTVRLALVHDLPEIYTGDIPTPAKYALPRFKEILNELEELVIGKVLPDHISNQFDCVDEDIESITNIIVKCGDIIAVTREIIDEQKHGNYINSDLNFVNDALTRLEEKFKIIESDDDYTKRVFTSCKAIISEFIGQIYI